MRRLLVLALLAVLSAGLVAPGAVGSARRSVTVRDDLFAPGSLTVRRGTVVSWRWTGRAPHNVTVVRGPQRFRSPTQTSGTFRRRLRRRGTYTLVCTLHAGMTQRVRVR